MSDKFGKRWRWLVAVAALMMAAAGEVGRPVPVRASGSGCAYEPYGDIADLWQSWGIGKRLGCPTAPDEFNWPGWYTTRWGRGRTFQRGIVAWWPFDNRRAFTMAVMQPPGTSSIEVDWKDSGSRDYYIVYWKGGGKSGQGTTSTGTTFSIDDAQPNTTYTVQVEGCDHGHCWGRLPEVSITTRT